MTKHFDLIVLGTSVAKSAVATRCRKAGWKVAIADTRGYGGTCALRGCNPAALPILGSEHLTTSDQFLDLDELPGRIVFLGSGYIAFEFAHVVASAGKK